MKSLTSTALLAQAVIPLASAYSLVSNYDHTNWYDSFTFQTGADPTNGFVDYVSQSDAQGLGMTKVVGSQVYMGVDNNTVISSRATGRSKNRSPQGRKSIWITSNKAFKNGILIGDFEHIPASDCGTWPAFWTISNEQGPYGEIDILESYNNADEVYTTLHTSDECTFQSPTALESGSSNQESYDCSLGSDIGCSVIGPQATTRTGFNEGGGGVYAMEWTSSHIRIYAFPRNAIPADITAGQPNPANWGIPTANFDTAHGNCDIDTAFLPQTIYFDTDFCGSGAGGEAWTSWSNPACSAATGYGDCSSYVAANPSAFDNAYWLVNSVKVYQ